MAQERLQKLWKWIKTIYIILYCGLILPFSALTSLDIWGIRDRIDWDDDLWFITTVPLVIYGLIHLARDERKNTTGTGAVHYQLIRPHRSIDR